MKILTFLCLLLLGAPLCAQSARPQAPTVNIGVGRDVAPSSRIQITINTRNLPAVNVAAWRLNDFKWLLDRDRQNRPKPAVSGKPALFFTTSVVDPKAKPNRYQIDVYRSRQINLPLLRPGVYLVEARGGGASDWGVVNVTNLAVLAKRSPSRLLGWVTDFRSGKVVPGAKIALWNRGGTPVAGASAATGADGTATFATRGGFDQVLVVTHGDDAAGVTVSNPEPDGKLAMHFQTDRPIYRPGHTAFWKAILRRTQGNGWTPLTNLQCQIEVRDSKDIVLWQESKKTGARGTLDGKFEIPAEGSLGQYSVVIKFGTDEAQYGSFTVAAYRKPEYEVVIEPEQRRYLAGDTLKFKLNATYFFGAPVPKATVRYTVRRAPLPLSFTDEEGEVSYFYGGDGNLYDRDSYGQNDVVADASADLDERGEATLQIPTPRDGQDATYAISATVTDGSRRQVDGGASVPVFRAAKRVAVAGEVSYVPVGFLMPLQIRVADLDGKPVAGRVTLELQEAVWQPKEQRYRYRNITSTVVEVPASGRAKATLPAQQQGTLRVRATMPDGTGTRGADDVGFLGRRAARFVADRRRAGCHRQARQARLQTGRDHENSGGDQRRGAPGFGDHRGFGRVELQGHSRRAKELHLECPGARRAVAQRLRRRRAVDAKRLDRRQQNPADPRSLAPFAGRTARRQNELRTRRESPLHAFHARR